MKFNIGDKVGLIEAPDVTGRIMQCYTSERGDNVYSIKWDEDGDGSLIDENRIVRIQNVTYKFKSCNILAAADIKNQLFRIIHKNF